jgi:NADH-quinone oxidoreductase subunit M
MGLLTFLIFWPAAMGLLLLLAPTDRGLRVGWIAAVFAAIECVAALWLWIDFIPGAGMQFVEYAEWIPRFGIAYRLGLDGISLLLVILTALLTLISVIASFTSITEHRRGFYAALLFLEAGVIGAFVATDVFLFYIFWEVMLIPMYFMIGVWGAERRIYATVKLVLYTMAGSLLMLVAILWMYQFSAAPTGVGTFNLAEWYALDVPYSAQLWLFGAFALAFAIKVPMFPFHTWLPDAHVQAPVAGSVMLAGVLLKLGTYGFFRFAIPLFPDGFSAFTPLIFVLSVIGIVYGAVMTLVQKDMKSLIAYSSISHLGFVMLGLVAFNLLGVSGSLLQQINHGISTGALFLLIGMIYERTHTRQIADYGGVFAVVPIFTIAFLLVTFSSIGLPGTNGFVGEFLILLGAFQTWPIFAIIATSAVILAAGYMLWLVKRVFFGPLVHAKLESLKDINGREFAILLPLLVLILWIGIYPRPFLDRINPALESWLEQVRPSELIDVPVDDDAPPFVIAPDTTRVESVHGITTTTSGGTLR